VTRVLRCAPLSTTRRQLPLAPIRRRCASSRAAIARPISACSTRKRAMRRRNSGRFTSLSFFHGAPRALSIAAWGMTGGVLSGPCHSQFRSYVAPLARAWWEAGRVFRVTSQTRGCHGPKASGSMTTKAIPRFVRLDRTGTRRSATAQLPAARRESNQSGSEQCECRRLGRSRGGRSRKS
jgi:hypothetical protein